MRLAVLIAAFATAAAAWAAPDEERLGKAERYPVCSVSPVFREGCLVGLLSHFDFLYSARTVSKGTPRALKRAEKEPAIAFRRARDEPQQTFDEFLARNRNTGLLVMQGDTILLKRYQYDRTPQMRFQSYSMAKTVVAMLVGIALAEGSIQSIDDRADAYVAELKGHPYGETSLRHLLTMSSGVRFRETYEGNDDSSELGMKTIGHVGRGGADSVSTFRTREAPAGTRFHYASAETQVLGLVLRAAVKKPLAEYLSEKIWQPMGAEADASWQIDSGGYETGYMGLNATLRDYGRFGLLLANGGSLEGREIIPAAWVKAATTAEAPHLQVGRATKFNGYGYQTWLIHPREPYFALLGVRGQGIFVDPVSKVVIVHTAVHASALDAGRAEQFWMFFDVVRALSAQSRSHNKSFPLEIES